MYRECGIDVRYRESVWVYRECGKVDKWRRRGECIENEIYYIVNWKCWVYIKYGVGIRYRGRRECIENVV